MKTVGQLNQVIKECWQEGDFGAAIWGITLYPVALIVIILIKRIYGFE